ncbi:MAG: sigma 54-interacting transcriptional regulator [Deltaproteobacteria bacterium]|nr:sigma 54-interacting transcriptional regulator [Deltaproteobacteria bacterium]
MNQHPTDTSAFLAANADCRATARLLVAEHDRSPRVVVLPAGAEVRIGRADFVEVPLEDHRASRVHATLAFDGRSVTVRDEGSSNGTFVAGAQVRGERAVEDGERIEIGSTKIIVLLTLSGAPRPAAPEASGADDEVVAVDPATVALFALVRRLAASDLPVLVQGETGVGKELVARALHRESPRARKAFVAINCATLTESIAASELFGHERGSFSGADARKVGVFESADGGTLLLDEVGELSQANQALLLRALQERSITRVGSTRPVPVDVRIVAATNRDLPLEVEQGRFRQDLYFRLNGVTVQVPPLRSRPRDILPMAEKILASRGGRWTLGPGVAAALESYPWTGNARELRHVIERGMALAERDEILLEHLCLTPAAMLGSVIPSDEPSAFRSRVEDTERRTIVEALASAGGNQSRAARELGISRRCLITRMERYGLKPKPVSVRES